MMSTSKQRVSEVVDYYTSNGFDNTISKYTISEETLHRYLRFHKQYYKTNVDSDKKMGEMNWREWADYLIKGQELHEKASWSQDEVNLEIKTKFPCIVFKPLADFHLGSVGVNYKSLIEFTDLFINTPYLYGALLGDETDNFVSFKNQLAVLQQMMSPEKQDEFFYSWLMDIIDKMLFATVGNHSAFEERVSGKNALKKILNRNLPYFNGIGVCNIKINDQVYKIVATHKTRAGSSTNLTHGLKTLARRDIPNADLYLSAHVHTPDIEYTFERGLFQIFMVMGTLKQNDGYAKRDFAYFTAEKDGAIVMDTTKHRMIPFPCLDDALEYAKLKNGE